MSAIGYPKVLKPFVDEMLTTYTLYNAEGTERTQFNDYLSLAPAPAPEPETVIQDYALPASTYMYLTMEDMENISNLGSASNLTNSVETYTVADGIKGQGIATDVNKYYRVLFNENLTLQDYTMSAWANITSHTRAGFLSSRYLGTSGNIFLGFNDNGVMFVFCGFTGVAFDEVVTTGEWVHYAVTVTQTTAKLYKNGVLIETKPLSRSGSLTITNVAVGVDIQEPHNWYSVGVYDDVALFLEELSAQQIKDIYDYSKDPNYNLTYGV